jgi:hypothetical protein
MRIVSAIVALGFVTVAPLSAQDGEEMGTEVFSIL